MQTHSLVQGSAEWLAHRRNFFNASDAPAMMNCSPYETRDHLIARLATGITPEVDAMTQRRFDEGHRIEALARPHAAAIIGEALFPVTGSEGKLSASFDGLTMAEDVAFEHKTLNAALRAAIPEGELGAGDSEVGGSLPLQYRVQMEQQLMVSGAERVLFMASEWNGEELVEERHCWYTSDAALAKQIAAGWVQLEKDVAAYTPPEAIAPAPTGRAPETLPALFVTVKGEVTASNLAEFKDVALAAIRNVNRELTTDQHFADAEKAVKWCTNIEERVASTKQHALSQTATIDELFKALDDISEEARQTRIDLSKLVTARKNSLKSELLIDAQTKLGDYLRECNKRIGRDYMPHVTADFAGAIHGKKNFDSMRAALNAALANAKIEASGKADLIQANLQYLNEDVEQGHAHLFPDLGAVVLKAADDFRMLVDSRIAEQKAKRLRDEEKQREAIREEERIKAEAEARAKVLAEQEAERLAAEAAKPAPVAAPAVASITEKVQEVVRAATPPNAAPVVRQPVKTDTPPSLKLGEINARLQCMTVTAANLAALGFEPTARDKGAVLFHEHEFPAMCRALVRQIHTVSELQAA